MEEAVSLPSGNQDLSPAVVHRAQLPPAEQPLVKVLEDGRGLRQSCLWNLQPRAPSSVPSDDTLRRLGMLSKPLFVYK